MIEAIACVIIGVFIGRISDKVRDANRKLDYLIEHTDQNRNRRDTFEEWQK